MAQMVLDPDLAATAASGSISENALNFLVQDLISHTEDGWAQMSDERTTRRTYVKTQLEAIE